MGKKEQLSWEEDITNKAQATKDYIIMYIANRGDDKTKAENKAWFAEVYKRCQKKCGLSTAKNEDIPDWIKIKKEFINKFFPNLNKTDTNLLLKELLK